MTTAAIRFLQEESARLQKENAAQKEQIQSLQRYIGALAELYWAARQISEEADLLDLLDRCLYNMLQVVDAKDGSLARLDPETGELVFTIVHGELREQLTGHRIRSDTGVAGWALSNNEMVIVNNARQDWRFFQEIDDEFAFLTHSILCAPVVSGDKSIGVIELLNKNHPEFTEQDTTLLSVLCDVAAAVLEDLAARSDKI